MKHALAVLVILSGLAAGQTPPAAAPPEINTDRPAVTDSSVVVPRASLQIENGAAWTSDHGHQTVDLPESLLRLGILSKTELRLGIPDYSEAVTGAGQHSGFGDLSFGLKQQLGPLPGDFDLSVVVAVSLPTGQPGVTSGTYDPFIQFPWSKDLKEGWSLGGQQSFFWDTLGSHRNGIWEPALYVEKQLTHPLAAFVEYAGDYQQRSDSRQLLHFGTVYKITPLNQVDFHFGFGLNATTPNHFFAVGYSLRLDRLWH